MDKTELNQLYFKEGLSVREISHYFNCSESKVNYWMSKWGIVKRNLSDSQYVKHNGFNDPFLIKKSLTPNEEKLFGLGIGIYWGEGNKKNKTAVRVGNTDAALLLTFVKFLVVICGVQPEKIRYGLQLFSDVSEDDALKFWQAKLHITRSQIMPTVNRIKSGKIGTYRSKNQYGVMTAYVFNKKIT